MEEIVKFSQLLRREGIPVSLRSTLAAAKAKNILEKQYFKEGLAAIYVKDQQFRGKFDKIFSSYFSKKKGEEKREEDEKTFINKNHSKRKPKPYCFTLEEDYTRNGYEHTSEKYLTLLEEIFNEPQKTESLINFDLEKINYYHPQLLHFCQLLGRKVATRRARRNKMARKNQPDVRRTIRRNLKNGGILLDLVKKKPLKRKADYYFLTDVSGSCDWISNWFLALIYAARNTFPRIRIYDFDNQTLETTSLLDELSLEDALDTIQKKRKMNNMVHGTSNMYNAFRDFLNLVQLNYKSVVIILTDCRDWDGPQKNGKPLSAKLVNLMSKKCRRLIILNPEPQNKWNVVDSQVSHYEEAGAELHEVRNLKQLASFISEI